MATKTATKAPASNGAKQQYAEIGGKAYPIVGPGPDVHTMIIPVGQHTTQNLTSLSGADADERLRVWLRAGYTLLPPQVIGSQTDMTFVTNVLYVFVKYE